MPQRNCGIEGARSPSGDESPRRVLGSDKAIFEIVWITPAQPPLVPRWGPGAGLSGTREIGDGSSSGSRRDQAVGRPLRGKVSNSARPRGQGRDLGVDLGRDQHRERDFLLGVLETCFDKPGRLPSLLDVADI